MLPERFQKLKKALCARQNDLTVLLENVQKPHNMAAILRSCEAIGIHRVHLISADGLRFNKPKSAAGVLRWIELQRHEQQRLAYAHLRQQGFRIIAAHPSASATDFRDYDYTQATAIVMGTERTGLTEGAIADADELITIPMHGLVQSLNVSVSAALILFEAQRQRQQKGLYDESGNVANSAMDTLFEWAWPRIANYCRAHKLPYPELDPENGQILDMKGFKKIISERT
jgi:tRNA (guanosine-2'-O-)-methyltransferase